MSRRTAAGLVALALVAVFVVLGAMKPVPWVTFSPGPTIDVLGELDGKEIIEVVGHKSYPGSGELLMVTVYQTRPERKLNLVEMLGGWVDPDVSVVPRDAVFREPTTDKQQRQQSAAEMTSSQDSATAAALTAAGIDYVTRVVVSDVTKGGPAEGKLEKGDVLLAVNGKRAADAAALVEAIRSKKPGSAVVVTVRRSGAEKAVRIVTTPADDDPKASRIGIGLGVDYVFPFKVVIRIPETVGGPSAGLIFALSIYDAITPGPITGGKVIAGTGEIDPAGIVGPIGGVGQKIAGAERDGARLFLVPKENCAEAANAHYDEKKIRLVEVHTLDDAIRAVEAWQKDPDVKLPECA